MSKKNTANFVDTEKENIKTGLSNENKINTEEIKKRRYIYIGPSVSIGLRKNNIFVGTETEVFMYLEKYIKKCPQIKNLLIETSNLAKTKNKVSQKGTLLNKYYGEILSFVNAKKEAEESE